jgi:sugar/nucleoside kinase (ribokinase family)
LAAVLGVVGNLSIDRVAGAAPRIGGGPYHAARALRLLGARGELFARCADADRRFLLPRLAALGMPLRLQHGEHTAQFSFEYDGDERTMHVDAIGDVWTPRDARAVDRRVRWLHVAPLLRSDFAVETLAELARGRRLLFDGQGLVRRPEVGPLQLDDEFDPEALRFVRILKLAEEEAAIVGDVDVAERVVTLGSRGAIVYANGRETHVTARPLPRDPTGAGDAFAAAYLASRAAGHTPAAAARRAIAAVAAAIR